MQDKINVKVTVSSLEAGRELLAENQRQAGELLIAMRDATTNTDWDDLADKRYQLKQQRHNIQSQMVALFKQKRGVKI